MANLAWFIFITLIIISAQIYIFSKWGLSGIKYKRSFSEQAVFPGEEIEMIDELINNKILPVPWIRLESRISKDLKFVDANLEGRDDLHRTLFSMLPYQKIRRRQPLICLKRGYYQFDRVEISTGDPFGFGEDFIREESPAELIVYPSLTLIEDIPLPSHSWLGEMVVRRWIMEDPFLTAGVRDYAAGDALNTINWKATARTNQLQVTKNDFSADHYLMIYVNFNQTGDIWLPIVDEALIEKAVSYAASIAAFSISKGVSTGFGCNTYMGSGRKTPDTIRIEPENSQHQLTYILETMAKLTIDANKSISFFLQEDIDRKIRGKDILIITANVSNDVKKQIETLKKLGNAVEMIEMSSEITETYQLKEEKV